MGGDEVTKGEVSKFIPAEPDVIWSLVGQFGGIEDWLPDIDSCDVDGDQRVVHTVGMTIHERLLHRDDALRTISYQIVESPIPLDHHRATISVTPDSGGARIGWSFEVRPDHFAPAFAQNYEGCLAFLAARFDG